MGMSEQWKTIEGCEGKYQVSNLGNVKRISDMGDIKLVPRKDATGNYKVMIIHNWKQTRVYVYNLVAKHFGRVNSFNSVHHSDGNKLNNSVSNLLIR